MALLPWVWVRVTERAVSRKEPLFAESEALWPGTVPPALEPPAYAWLPPSSAWESRLLGRLLVQPLFVYPSPLRSGRASWPGMIATWKTAVLLALAPASNYSLSKASAAWSDCPLAFFRASYAGGACGL